MLDFLFCFWNILHWLLLHKLAALNSMQCAGSGGGDF
jgi:hypothetical protein